ncbi:unnamed protein product [Didymodactylos carnosus]|uniref:Uncharacterized protein n=1 Tax=Didymodactylos carnosus TaxID=1234261 RepID=A0A814YS30_9BILA|nr:unnamed protein product [Didymodactylos carnosus]CAF3994932.1 unnamed protein product [Didymodactylos carnosus]
MVRTKASMILLVASTAKLPTHLNPMTKHLKHHMLSCATRTSEGKEVGSLQKLIKSKRPVHSLAEKTVAQMKNKLTQWVCFCPQGPFLVVKGLVIISLPKHCMVKVTTTIL